MFLYSAATLSKAQAATVGQNIETDSTSSHLLNIHKENNCVPLPPYNAGPMSPEYFSHVIVALGEGGELLSERSFHKAKVALIFFFGVLTLFRPRGGPNLPAWTLYIFF